MGDPSGIGPEIIVKALSSESLINFIPIVIGSKKVIAKQININMACKNCKCECEICNCDYWRCDDCGETRD